MLQPNLVKSFVECSLKSPNEPERQKFNEKGHWRTGWTVTEGSFTNWSAEEGASPSLPAFMRCVARTVVRVQLDWSFSFVSGYASQGDEATHSLSRNLKQFQLCCNDSERQAPSLLKGTEAHTVRSYSSFLSRICHRSGAKCRAWQVSGSHFIWYTTLTLRKLFSAPAHCSPQFLENDEAPHTPSFQLGTLHCK